MNRPIKANFLIDSNSPYLLQHAYNPVNWHMWNELALDKAKTQDKPIIVSIGYSSCHWCHVMEKESFENQVVAQIMNKDYICIKVDREERPDIDQIYMDSLHWMGIQGGWPLNVFLMSDQKPFYGGTYFPRDAWIDILNAIAQKYRTDKKMLISSSVELTRAMKKDVSERYHLKKKETDIFHWDTLNAIYHSISQFFDHKQGGMKRAPKFPIPCDWEFILSYCDRIKIDKQLSNHEKIFDFSKQALKQLELTLDKMGNGGIYDQIGGGFSRYSVDENWFVPHFEKMLYDNGQLISLYSKAFMVFEKERYREIVYQSIDWIKKEMLSEENGFYSAMDADSEGEEGKYYIWSMPEVKEILGRDAPFAIDYYNIKLKGNWEDQKNILHVNKTVSDFCQANNISQELFQKKLKIVNQKLLNQRNKRISPSLDNKILLSWNCLMTQGLLDAYNAFLKEEFIILAKKNVAFIENKMQEGDQLYRSYQKKQKLYPAYLEDYAHLIKIYINFYQIDFNEQWLNKAVRLMDHTIKNFYDKNETLFFFTAKSKSNLILRKKEIFDNVIPSSNSVMANNLFLLGTLLHKEEYLSLSKKMLLTVFPLLKKNPNSLTNWNILYLNLMSSFLEIIILGDELNSFRNQIAKKYISHKVLLGTKTSSNLSLLKDKTIRLKHTQIHLCYDKICQNPMNKVSDLFKILDIN